MDESLTKAGVYHFGCLAEINKDCSKFTQLDVFSSRALCTCTSSIKYLNSKPKVYMCHFINSRHKSQKCVVFVGDPSAWISELVVCMNTIWIAVDTDMNSASVITNADVQFQAWTGTGVTFECSHLE